LEDLRLKGRVDDLAKVKVAYVERKGDVNAVPKEE
jgi:hypothetical protein